MFAAIAALWLVPVAPPNQSWPDRLDPAAIPPAERLPWHPPELVGVLGTHRGRHWGWVRAATLSPDAAVVASGGTVYAAVTTAGTQDSGDPAGLVIRLRPR